MAKKFKKLSKEERAEFKNGKYMGGPAEERAEKKTKRMAEGGRADTDRYGKDMGRPEERSGMPGRRLGQQAKKPGRRLGQQTKKPGRRLGEENRPAGIAVGDSKNGVRMKKVGDDMEAKDGVAIKRLDPSKAPKLSRKDLIESKPMPMPEPKNLPPGLANRPGGLPPGLANRPGGLPPGLAGKLAPMPSLAGAKPSPMPTAPSGGLSSFQNKSGSVGTQPQAALQSIRMAKGGLVKGAGCASRGVKAPRYK